MSTQISPSAAPQAPPLVSHAAPHPPPPPPPPPEDPPDDDLQNLLAHPPLHPPPSEDCPKLSVLDGAQDKLPSVVAEAESRLPHMAERHEAPSQILLPGLPAPSEEIEVAKMVEDISGAKLLELALQDAGASTSPPLADRAERLWQLLQEELLLQNADDLRDAVTDGELLIDLRQYVKGKFLHHLRQRVRGMNEASGSQVKSKATGKDDVVSLEEARALLQTEDISAMQLMDALRYELEINPKNIVVAKTADEDGMTPMLLLTFITKMQWNACRCLKAQIQSESISLSESQIQEDLLIISGHDQSELFNSFHYPSVPQIRTLNDAENKLDKETSKPVIKKVPQGQSLVLPKGEWLDNKEATRQLKQQFASFLRLFPSGSQSDLEVGRYQATQKWSFQVSVPSFLAGAVLRYPLDVHNVHCKLAFDPLPARKWLLPSKLMEARAKIPIYQLSPPASFSLLQKPRKFFKSDDKEMKIVEEGVKVNVYPRVATKPWSQVAHTAIKELLNDFDVKPFSMEISTDPGPPPSYDKRAWPPDDERLQRMEKHFEKGTEMKFTLVRHVIAPTLSVLLPLWVIQLMLPFVWLHDLSDNNDAYAYLITLLLTVTAHRSIMEAKLAFVQCFTSPDMEFIKTIVLLAVQMVVLSFFNLASDEIVIGFQDGDERFMFAEGIRIKFVIFASQLFLSLMYIAYQVHRAFGASRDVTNVDSVTALTQDGVVLDRILSLARYQSLVNLRSKLEVIVRREMKNAAERSSEPDAVAMLRRDAENARVDRKTFFSYNLGMLFRRVEPSDLFRMRLDSRWRKIIDGNNIGTVLYCKELKEVAGDGSQIKYGDKVVYEVLQNIKLEIQFVGPDDVHLTSALHSELKYQRLKKGVGVRTTSTCTLLSILFKSMWFEIRHGCRCSRIYRDWTLYRIATRAQKHTHRSPSAVCEDHAKPPAPPQPQEAWKQP
jgi:hypothetical protein